MTDASAKHVVGVAGGRAGAVAAPPSRPPGATPGQAASDAEAVVSQSNSVTRCS